MSNSNVSNDLFSILKNYSPSIKLGDKNNMTVENPADAVFFEFDFVVRKEKIASISISIAEETDSTGQRKTPLKMFFNQNILKDKDNIVKHRWADFLKTLRRFCSQKRLDWQPKDIVKPRLDKRDYKLLATKTQDGDKDLAMSESSLYGSTRSSYQKLENTRLIIRHSTKIQEESPNSRTRNIHALYVESADGERFRYPFVHLSGARAMQRHVANGGNPYDGFGQYVVSLSEQVYNLRKFNSLVSRNAFLENTEISGIAEKARIKTKGIKKVLERIQKQGGYETVKENFTTFKKIEVDSDTLESLKNRFTIQKFNEELVELFPYITDLLGEEVVEATDPRDSRPQTWRPNNTGYAWDKLATRMTSDPKDSKARKAGKQSGLKHSIKDALGKHGPKGHLPESQIDELASRIAEISDKIAKATHLKRAQNYAAADTNPQGGSPEEEKAWDKYKKNDDLMQKRSAPKTEASAKASDAPTADDAADEPVTDYKGKERDPSYLLLRALEQNPVVEIEQYDKVSLKKMMDFTRNQYVQMKQAAQENPRDNKAKWSLEKVEARLSLLKSKIASAEKADKSWPLFIEHISEHIKDINSPIYPLLKQISNDWDERNVQTGQPRMDAEQKKEAIGSLKKMLSKAKIVPLFHGNKEVHPAETIAFEDLESMLELNETTKTTRIISNDPLMEYERILNNIITEESNLLSTDPDIKEQAIKDLNKLMEKHFPVGVDGMNAIGSLQDIIDDPELLNTFKEMSQKDADTCVRPVIMDWVKEKAPEVAEKLNTGDMDQDTQAKPEQPPAEADVAVGETEEDMIANRKDTYGDDGESSPKEILEYVKSLYDLEQGTTPRGDMGVMISAKKQFGDHPETIQHIKKCIMMCKGAGQQSTEEPSDLLRIKELAGMRF